jgi:hypothetical protein
MQPYFNAENHPFTFKFHFMKKLKIVLTALSLITASVSFAQVEQGNLLLGGTASMGAEFNEFNDVFGVDISPNIGYFVDAGLAIGGALSFGYSKSDNSSATRFGLIPFARFYFTQSGNLMFFLQAKAGILTNRFDNGFSVNSSNGGVFGGGPGMAIFLTDQIAIEGAFELLRYGGDFRFTDLGLRFGVQAYLGQSEK